MKFSLRKTGYLLIAVAVCTGLALTGCNNGGDAPGVEASSSPTPSPSVSASAAPAPSESSKELPLVSAQEEKPVQSSWTEIARYALDFDGDQEKETVYLYTEAEKGSDGKIAWNDGQQWTLYVEDGGRYYPLYDERVQNGKVYFEVSDYYTEEDTVLPTITLIKSAGAQFAVFNYSFDSEKDGYTRETVYDSGEHSVDGINQRFSSIPDIE